jgi:hypothetical protein
VCGDWGAAPGDSNYTPVIRLIGRVPSCSDVKQQVAVGQGLTTVLCARCGYSFGEKYQFCGEIEPGVIPFHVPLTRPQVLDPEPLHPSRYRHKVGPLVEGMSPEDLVHTWRCICGANPQIRQRTIRKRLGGRDGGVLLV